MLIKFYFTLIENQKVKENDDYFLEKQETTKIF
jgi:hypothetical protein